VTAEDRPTLWGADEVCDYLGISVETLYHWRSRNFGPPCRRIGRNLRFVPSEVIGWFESIEREDGT
jgi:predicted DNA-binding transcriptional regulator AlpA